MDLNTNNKDQLERIYNEYKEQYPNQQLDSDLNYLIYIFNNNHHINLSETSSKLLIDLSSQIKSFDNNSSSSSETCRWFELANKTRENIISFLIDRLKVKPLDYNDITNGLKNVINHDHHHHHHLSLTNGDHHQCIHQKVLYRLCDMYDHHDPTDSLPMGVRGIFTDILVDSLKSNQKDLSHRAVTLSHKFLMCGQFRYTISSTELNHISLKLSYSLLETLKNHKNDMNIIDSVIRLLGDFSTIINQRRFARIVLKLGRLVTQNIESKLVQVIYKWFFYWKIDGVIGNDIISRTSIYLPCIVKHTRDEFINNSLQLVDFNRLCQVFQDNMYPYLNSFVPLAIKFIPSTTVLDVSWDETRLLFKGLLFVPKSVSSKKTKELFQLLCNTIADLHLNLGAGEYNFKSSKHSFDIARTLIEMVDLVKDSIEIRYHPSIIDWIIDISYSALLYFDTCPSPNSYYYKSIVSFKGLVTRILDSKDNTISPSNTKELENLIDSFDLKFPLLFSK